MHVPTSARRIGAAVLVTLAVAPSAAHAATAAERNLAVQKGVSFMRTKQDAAGRLNPGFSEGLVLSALAAAGVHPADVRVGTNPSAQDFYAGQFGAATTPNSLAILGGEAAGLDSQRLAAQTNQVAFLAAAYNADGSFAGGSTNAVTFTTLALARVGAPAGVLAKAQANLRSQQHDDGGWNYGKAATPTARAGYSGVDITGATIAALCETGATTNDATVRAGIAFLRSQQDPATGGYGDPDSDGWALSGLNACGVPFDAGRMTTATGLTIADELIDMQDDQTGGWPTYDNSIDLYATQDAVRALAGEGFGADTPRRANAADPTRRAAVAVDAGTVTPHALAIDDGAGDVRFCRVDVAAGATLAQVLAAAQTASTPAGCVTSSAVTGGAVSAINGAAGTWRLEVDKRPSEAASADRVIAFGDTVGLTRSVSASGGAQGEPGQTGPAGSNGTNGANGANGTDGAAGPAGPAGPVGPTGPKGPRGKRGKRGKPGKAAKRARASRRATAARHAHSVRQAKARHAHH